MYYVRIIQSYDQFEDELIAFRTFNTKLQAKKFIKEFKKGVSEPYKNHLHYLLLRSLRI